MRKSKTASHLTRERILRFAALLLLLPGVILFAAQAAFAENTYVITDGEQVVVHTTSATDPDTVLSEAGLELGAADTYTTQETNGVSEITVRRSQTVTVKNGTQLLTAETYGETVGQLLARLGVQADEQASFSAGLHEQTYDGMVLTGKRTVVQEETYTQVVPHDTVYCDDASLPAGTEQILISGKDGELRRTVQVTYENGTEVGRHTLSEQMPVAPVRELIARGTGETPAAPAAVTSGGTFEVNGGLLTTPTGEVLTYTRKMTMLGTAYSCEGYTGLTAIGTIARVGAIAVDPTVIPYGTRMFIVSRDGEYIYGIATAEDCGGDGMKGNRIDLYMDTVDECFQFGKRYCDVYILG